MTGPHSRTRQLHVFCGPTITAAQARLRLSQPAEFHPPARCGSIEALHGQACDVLIIDGIFEGAPAVWHKEILSLLSSGARVFGCSSMGALRAVETEPWGARGLGSIAAAYRAGRIAADDVVALAHADSDDEHRPLSVPLADLDDHAQAAVAAGVLSPAAAAACVEAAESLFYADRSWNAILQPLPVTTRSAFRSFAAARTGLKTRDAESALQALPQLLAEPAEAADPAFPPAEPNQPTQQLRRLRHTLLSRAHSAASQPQTTPQDPDLPYDALRAGLVRALLAQGAAPDLAAPTPGEACAELAGSLGISADALPAWARSRHLSDTDLIRFATVQSLLQQAWDRYGDEAAAAVPDHLLAVDVGRQLAADRADDDREAQT